MKNILAIAARVGLLAGLLATFRAAIAEEPAALEPEQGVLVLTNGQTLPGKITRAGDHYYVALADGAIKLPASQVVLHCRNLQEAYEKQRTARTLGGSQNHLRLAQWCLTNKLYAESQQELDAAAKVEPHHPKIAVLRRKLELEQRPAAPRASVTSPVQTLVAAEELDRLSRGMPAGAMETYANVIQPLLLNHCATAACHGAQTTASLRLMRGTGGGAPTRRLTQRNLYHVLEFVEHGNGAQSPLLKAASEPHGPSRTPIFNSRQAEQYRQLADWVRVVAQSAKAPSKAAVAGEAGAMQRIPGDVADGLTTPPPSTLNAAANSGSAVNAARPPQTPRDVALAAKWATTEGDEQFRVAEDGTILTNLPDSEILADDAQRRSRVNKQPIRGAAGMAQRGNVKRGAVQQVTPKDPFDPELFNRQFHAPRP